MSETRRSSKNKIYSFLDKITGLYRNLDIKLALIVSQCAGQVIPQGGVNLIRYDLDVPKMKAARQ